MQEIEWFEDREMDQVIMVDGEKEIVVDIASKAEAKYYYDLQAKGITFKPKLRVHRAPPSECESCSA